MEWEEKGMTGTTLTIYDTKTSPEPFSDEKGTHTQTSLISTIGVLVIPKDTIVGDNYVLKIDLYAEVRFEDDKYVVIDYRVDEYGIGDSLDTAEKDVIDSLADYLVSLERRESRLGAREQQTLQILREILAKK